jgi:defect in organelle trafficking protein DotD
MASSPFARSRGIMSTPCGDAHVIQLPTSRHRIPAFASAVAAALLAGCVGTPNVGTDVLTTGMPNPEIALRESMRLVDTEMTKLGTLNPSTTPRFTEGVVPAELQKTVTFAYSGPLDDGIRKLAETVGYVVAITPPPPPQPGATALPPLIVSVSTGFVTAVSAFAALGDAAGSRAMVRVDPQRHLVEVIHYA